MTSDNRFESIAHSTCTMVASDVMPLAYFTTGLREKGGCDLLVEGLPYETAKKLLSSFALLLASGTVTSDRPAIFKGALAHGYDVSMISVDVSHLPIASNDGDVGGPSVRRIMQLVVPDQGNKFPWQDEFDAKGMAAQFVYRRSIHSGQPDSHLQSMRVIDVSRYSKR